MKSQRDLGRSLKPPSLSRNCLSYSIRSPVAEIFRRVVLHYRCVNFENDAIKDRRSSSPIRRRLIDDTFPNNSEFYESLESTISNVWTKSGEYKYSETKRSEKLATRRTSLLLFGNRPRVSCPFLAFQPVAPFRCPILGLGFRVPPFHPLFIRLRCPLLDLPCPRQTFLEYNSWKSNCRPSVRRKHWRVKRKVVD